MANRIVYKRTSPFVVLIRDASGTEVQFHSEEDFVRVMGQPSPQAENLNYEPDKGIYVVNQSNRKSSIPDVFYEDLIANVATHLANQGDPYYGMTPAQAAAEAVVVHMDKAKESLEIALFYLREQDDRVARGLDPIMSPSEYASLDAYIHLMQGEINTPSDDPSHTIADLPVLPLI